MIHLLPSVRAILQQLEQNGFAAYAVGGCIRNSLLGLPVHDWDLTTSATPDEMTACFAGEHLLPTGIRHGTMTLLRDGIPYEITTFRRESGYIDHRRPDRVDFVRDLREDLLRRDFTVNAMACDSTGRLSDPFGGQNDLRLHILRCVGDAETRLKEDALRILRALRFAACYDLTPEPQTEKALFALCGTLAAVSRERVLQELRRMLCGKSTGEITARFFPVLRAAVPGLMHEPPHLPSDFPNDEPLRFAWLFSGHTASEAESFLRVLRAENRLRREVTAILSLLPQVPDASLPVLRRQLAEYGETALRGALRLSAVCGRDSADTQIALDRLLENETCFSVRDLALSGTDLLALGFRGAAIGETQRQLLEAVFSGRCVNTRESLLEEISRLPPSFKTLT